MKKSRDIEVARLTSELASIQSRVAFLEGRQAGCVSREEYDAVIAERDAAMMGFTLSLTVRPAGNREQCR